MTTQIRVPDVPARSARSIAIDAARNFALLFVLWMFYTMVRKAAADEVTAAVEHSRQILNLQSALGLPHEASIQAGFLDHTSILRAANLYYMWAHFPVTAAFMFWAWFRHRPAFSLIRNTIIIVTAFGLALHLAYPLAPPRMLNDFVDTGVVFGPSPYDLDGAAEAANQFAAMPSMHVGWALLVAMSVVTLTASRLRFVALAHPAITAFVVVVTANHYWTDAIVAIMLVVATWTAVRFWERRYPNPFSALKFQKSIKVKVEGNS